MAIRACFSRGSGWSYAAADGLDGFVGLVGLACVGAWLRVGGRAAPHSPRERLIEMQLTGIGLLQLEGKTDFDLPSAELMTELLAESGLQVTQGVGHA